MEKEKKFKIMKAHIKGFP